jgi:hypothetical protein
MFSCLTPLYDIVFYPYEEAFKGECYITVFSVNHPKYCTVLKRNSILMFLVPGVFCDTPIIFNSNWIL